MEKQTTEMSAMTNSRRETAKAVEPGIWTERMLAARARGLPGGKWYSLMDKVYQEKTLQLAWTQVRKNRGSAGVDGETIDRFKKHTNSRLATLGERLRNGTYRPNAVRRVHIPKERGKTRPLGIPCLKDRIVQAAVCLAIEPIFEYEFSENSYGFRKGKSAKDALRRVDQQLKNGYRYVVDVDLESYFDSIPHEKLMTLVRERINDGRLLELIEFFLHQRVMEECKNWIPTSGTPQGGVLSPLLANIYLNPLDHLMSSKGYQMTRYADDMVVLCASQEEAESALAEIQQWVDAAELKLHPVKTRVVSMDESDGFDFLGYRFSKDGRSPRKRSLDRYKDAIRSKTRRANGHSLGFIIIDINRTARGWFEYFKHSNPAIFPLLDSWTRMRLRSILRKRHGGKGRGRGTDHWRWPNSFFAEQGLFTMKQAYCLARHAL